ncbi:MAG: cytochrome c5 family protein [Chlorobium sp.]|jgi:cytochrome c5|nr:MAG: cytochrome c5 family protein [Chlorobium sp.]
MTYKFIRTAVFSVVFLSGLQNVQAEATGKLAEKIQPASNNITLTKEVLEKKYNLIAGKKSYSSAGCAMCHDNAVMGAPRPGDTKSWISRLNNGWDQIVKHSLTDYNGMPAKGGNNTLSEIDIENIDAYLISLVVS